MAERRMFSKSIIDSDAFLDMSLSTQALYFHLAMRADDEGFINNPKRIMRMIGASDDEMRLLIAKSFIIPFESGIVVIKHWRIHNYIRKDRFKETVYTFEKSMLSEMPNGEYILKSCGDNYGIPAVDQLDTNGIPDNNQVTTNGIPCGVQNGYRLDTQVSIGKVSIDKDKYISCSSPESDGAKETATDTKKQREKEADAMFERLWARYPRKAGKNSVKKTRKLELLKFGEEELSRALDRFIADMQGRDTEYIPYGSTWFNGGYVDYLDANYQPRSNGGMQIRKDKRKYKYVSPEGPRDFSDREE